MTNFLENGKYSIKEVIVLFGLGKERTAFGKWIDKRGISQTWIVNETKLNKYTISKIANSHDHIPSGRTMRKILTVLRKVDPTVKQDDFWSV